MKDKLKPCPFCGGETVIRESSGHFYLRPIHDKNCSIKPDTWLIADKPLNNQIKAWNRRATLSKDTVVLTEREHEIAMTHQYDVGYKFGYDKGSKETADKFANEVYKELYQLGKIYALPETLDADKYGIFSLTQEVIAKVAKEQFDVKIKEN